MKREHQLAQPQGDSYLFNFPLMEDGLNYGNLPESQYIPKLRNYGSTSTTPNFNDSLTFDSYYGELAHRHTGCANKLVSSIDYQNFDLNAWLNDNNWELNLDFYFYGYNGYQQVLEMLRCTNGQTIGLDIRWLSNNYGVLYFGDGTQNLIGQNPTYVTRQWVRANLVKIGSMLEADFVKLSDASTLSNNSLTISTFKNYGRVQFLTLFGCYIPGNSANSQRYTIGATKNFYLKKL